MNFFTNIKTINAKVVVLTESKLDDTIPNSLLVLPGFHEPLRRDRNRHGGGCLVYISETLTFKQQFQYQSNLFKNISVDVRLSKKNLFCKLLLPST